MNQLWLKNDRQKPVINRIQFVKAEAASLKSVSKRYFTKNIYK
jgi:hypothetical protein